jgi:hypothetical protein
MEPAVFCANSEKLQQKKVTTTDTQLWRVKEDPACLSFTWSTHPSLPAPRPDHLVSVANSVAIRKKFGKMNTVTGRQAA